MIAPAARRPLGAAGVRLFVLLPAAGGQTISNSTEILISPTMFALVEELNHRVPLRVVVCDRPPSLHTADVFAFSHDTDALAPDCRTGEDDRGRCAARLDAGKRFPSRSGDSTEVRSGHKPRLQLA
jgi:hypothetical protein